jgi:hypothetical protein
MRTEKKDNLREDDLVDFGSDYERRTFADQFTRSHPGVSHGAVIDALSDLASKAASPVARETLERAIEDALDWNLQTPTP